MIRWDEESAETKLRLYRKLVIVFAVWAVHAIANLVSRVTSSKAALQPRWLRVLSIKFPLYLGHNT